MTFPAHTLQLVPGVAWRPGEHIEIVTHRPRRGAPLFCAPTLPTPNQLSRDVPFTENFRSSHPRSR